MKTSTRVAPLSTSVFAVLARRLQNYTGKRYPFHVGDNSIAPPDGARWDTIDVAQFGDPYAYGHPSGALALREALARFRTARDGFACGPDQVLISVGATHGITCTIQALVDPGDEVLLLSPYWPLVRGISHCAGVVPVDVPFFQHLLDHPDADPASLIEPYLTERTRMIYVVSPNNPNGCVLTKAQYEAVAAVARARDLWVLHDEAYENFAYARDHISLSSLPGMAERTLRAFTFSKTYAMAGIRVGYVVGPERAVAVMRKVATHSVYNTSQACQAAALAAVASGPEFLEAGHAQYRRAAQLVTDHLEATFHPAQGSSFVFLDLRAHGPDAIPILERAADRGVTLAPGSLFGSGFDGYARLCYSATDEATLVEGIGVLNEVWRG